MFLISQGRAVYDRREVLRTLVKRDLRVRYARSWLGYLWTVLDPLAMAAIYFFVFTMIFKARDTGYRPYFLFLLVGLLAWQWFAGSLNETSRALLSEAKLVRSTNLPRELWVVRVVVAKGVEYVLSLPVLVVFATFYLVKGETSLHWGLVLFPLGVVMQFLLQIGIGLILAPVTTLATDMQRVVRIFLRMAFYLTPVIYSVRAAPEAVRPWLALNPMTGVVELYRAGLFEGQVDAMPIIVGGAIVIVLLVTGVVVFRHLERAVLKEI